MMVRIVVALIVGYLGYLIAFKKKINLLHGYHIKNIREEDKDMFCQMEGLGNITTAFGVLTNSLFFLFAGIAISVYAIHKYNGSLF